MIFSIDCEKMVAKNNKINGTNIQKTHICFKNELKRMDKARRADFYYEQLHNLFLVWKCMGVFPLHVSRKGTVTFKFISPATLYSLTAYITIICISYFNIQDVINYIVQLGENATFLHYMCACIVILLMVTYPSVSIAFWTQVNQIKSYIESWKEFQIIYRKITHFPLQIQLRTRTNITVILEVLGAFCVGLIAFLPPHQSVWRFIPYYCNMLLFDVLVSFWVITCTALQNANKCLLKHFKKKNEEHVDPEIVGNFRVLWLQLSRLANQTGHAMSGIYIVIFAFEFVLITFSLYCCLAGINRITFMIVFCSLIAFLLNVTPLYMMCNAAHNTTNMINTEMKNELELLKSAKQKRISQEVSFFLHTIYQNPPDISLSGFMTVNRGLFKSYACVIVTYLVVLMQFEVGLETKSSSLKNCTTSNLDNSCI